MVGLSLFHGAAYYCNKFIFARTANRQNLRVVDGRQDAAGAFGYNPFYMSAALRLWPLVPIAYLLGSIPFGLLVGLMRGVDPRQAGSGNIGATNVGRLLGGQYFALVFALDALKGLLPMLVAAWLLRGHEHDAAALWMWLLIGMAAIFGHMFSVFLKFKGGKGVATSAGVALGLFPYFTYPGLAALGVWAIIYFATRYVSVASIIASAAFPLAYVLIGLWRGWDVWGEQLPLLIFSSLVCVMVVVRHRSNIARLRAGKENRFTGKAVP